ncbi:Kelch repeat type 1 [Corchorus olitorius]|uniref:Kelch repeat type 1 n=1 Tax=Corchorus olitorius TaxID=93759 RepID=A0A1R3H4W1_9ROSI|nr:Kelch repeat type 1 [Corchorus olitorius]
MTTEKTSGPGLEDVIDARLDENLTGFKNELKTEIMVEVTDMMETLILSKKETATATTTAAVAAEVGREASPSSTKQQRLREEGIKRIYMIEGWSHDAFSFQCFVLNLENGEETTLTISPASDKDRVAVHLCSSVVALGSIIYMIGGQCPPGHCPEGFEGCRHPHPHVRYFDTCEPEKGWKLGAPMLTGRAGPAAAVVDGKIYVVGGLLDEYSDSNDVLAECFDPKTNEWRPLTVLDYEPTVYCHTQVPYVYDDGKKSILINSYMTKETLYEYLLDEQKWRIFDQTFEKCLNQGTILDDILYTVCEDAKNPLYGFHLSLKQWFPIEVELAKHSRIRVINVNASVFASGSDKLCLVWHYFDFTRARYSNYRKVECLEIKLNKSYSASGILNLTAHQESYHFFHVSSGCPEQIFIPM